MRITFLGAAEEVTGSCYLLEAGNARFLVDCGMFQGGREADGKNRAALDVDPGRLDFVLLTHAHLDHSGLLPRLSAKGYKGPVYATAATRDLLEVMLADSAYIQEKEAEWRSRGRRGPDPLYTVPQARAALELVRTIGYGETFSPHPAVRARYRDAGHIIGSASIETWVDEGGRQRKIVFSGDIGQPGHPIVQNPTPIDSADVLLIESTYGNRLHRSMEETVEALVQVIVDTISHRGGNVIIPAFAVGRTQDLIYLLIKLHRQQRLPGLEIYVDSPMATAATEVTLKHMELVDEEAAEAMRWLRSNDGKPHIYFVQDPEESAALGRIRGGAVIISASGMCDAGRIKHHLRNNLPRPECSIIFTGFQAEGTRGRKIVDRAQSVKIFGEEVPVRATIHTIGGLSAHADRAALLDWLGHFRHPPQWTFVVHGEAATAHDFAKAVEKRPGWTATVPQPRQSFQL